MFIKYELTFVFIIIINICYTSVYYCAYTSDNRAPCADIGILLIYTQYPDIDPFQVQYKGTLLNETKSI